MISHTLDGRLGAQVFLKCEQLQRVGAFNFRGAYNAVAQLDKARWRRGVVNLFVGQPRAHHRVGCSFAGDAAFILMRADTPSVKPDAMRAYRADVVLCERMRDGRETKGAALIEAHAFTLIPPRRRPRDHRGGH